MARPLKMNFFLQLPLGKTITKLLLEKAIFLLGDHLNKKHILTSLDRLLELPLCIKVEGEMAEVLVVALGLHHRDLLRRVALRPAHPRNFKIQAHSQLSCVVVASV